MKRAIRTARYLIQWLTQTKELVTLFVVPMWFGVTDWGLHVLLQLDWVYIGADLALLAVLAFALSLTEDIYGWDEADRDRGDILAKKLIGLGMFLWIWLFTLGLLRDGLAPGDLQVRAWAALIAGWLSLFLGFVCFVELNRRRGTHRS